MNRENIPEHVIESILQRVDIVDIVGRYVSLTKQGKNYSGLCPFHSEKTPSFLVSPDKQIFKCFGCGKGGDVFRFLMNIEGISFPEAVKTLGEEAGVAYAWQRAAEPATPEQLERRKLLEAHELAAKWYHSILMNTDAGRPAMDYLTKRGFSLKSIETFQIGYAPPMRDKLLQFLSSKHFEADLLERGGLLRSTEHGYVDLFRDRIMFPIHDPSGKVVAFAGRVLNEGNPKYLNSPDSPIFSKSRLLYNLHQAKAEIRKSKQAVLFEGYADVIKAREAGVLNGIAAMGTSFSDKHAAILERMAEEIVICYDGDEAGQAAALKSLQLLEKRRTAVRIAMLPRRLDPDEYISAHGAEAFRREVIEGAVSPAAYRLIRLRGQYKLSDGEGRLRYIRGALQVIAGLSSPTEREHHLRGLSDEFDYSLETLKQECALLRQELEKKQRIGDNNDNPWNNVMNNGRTAESAPALLPAYHNAERRLLAIMMHEPETTAYVAQQLGDGFHVEAHAALAAYIYAFYADHDRPSVSLFIGSLQEELADLASDISMLYSKETSNRQAVDDYIREIRKYPVMRLIEEKKKQMLQAERSGDLLSAAQIGSEIITLEKQMKSLQREKV
jgi:DNA primase